MPAFPLVVVGVGGTGVGAVGQLRRCLAEALAERGWVHGLRAIGVVRPVRRVTTDDVVTPQVSVVGGGTLWR